MSMKPYISESGLKSYLAKQGYSESKIRKSVDPSNADGLIGALLRSGFLERFENGWIVIDPVASSAWLMQKAAR